MEHSISLLSIYLLSVVLYFSLKKPGNIWASLSTVNSCLEIILISTPTNQFLLSNI